jgi:paraquat-inducible protein B
VLPLLAAGLTAHVIYRAVKAHGASITVTFRTADGLRPEQTQVQYKAVPLGTVTEVELGPDARNVVVHIDMHARAEPLLTENARFWVVRPRLQAGGISALQTGLQTLVSGPYIELDPGAARGAAKRHFRGLEQPPVVRSGELGTSFALRAREIGSLGSGSVLLNRQVPVGEVVGFDLDEPSGTVTIRVFIRAPHDKLVREQTVFWNVSGLDLGMSADGLHLELSSLRTVFSGGIEFQTPARFRATERAQPGHVFALHDTEAAAELALYGEASPYVVYLHDSVQGLAPGSPVKMFGVQVGNVTELGLVPDPAPRSGRALAARVAFVLQPERALAGAASSLLRPDELGRQVAHGLRVVLETSSIVTGEKALSLAYVPGDAFTPARDEEGRVVLPGSARGLGALTDALSDLAGRLNSIPYERIGHSLDHTLRSLDRVASDPELVRAVHHLAATLDEVRGLASDARAGLTPALSRLPAISAQIEEAVGNANAALASVAGTDGDFRRETQHMLTQVSDMARSVRLLADFLERHPEALLRGRSAQGAP